MTRTVKGLTSQSIKSDDVMLADGEDYFSVQGLSLVDITTLYNRHSGELGRWFEQLLHLEGGDNGVELQSASLAKNLLDTAPVLASEVIAYAVIGGGNDETIEIAKQLPIAVQIDALQKIGDLTFTETMPPKKVLEIVINAARSTATENSQDQKT